MRLFVSSPSDVFPERARVDAVAARLNGEFEGLVQIEVIRWETGFYTANRPFQKAIEDAVGKMHATDLVVCILWKRVGTELDPKVWLRPDGEPYESGTVLEVETALDVSRRCGAPDVYLFRKRAPITYDAATVEVDRAQHLLLEAVWKRWTQTKKGHNVAGYQRFTDPDDFEHKLDLCIRQWLERRGIVLRTVWDRRIKGSPFRGFEAFDAGHAPVFFGREPTIERALAKLRRAEDAGTPFLLLVGASGSGKSSLLRAGLVPRITRPGTIPGIDLWRSALVVPAGDPLTGLAEALFRETALGEELRAGDFGTPELLDRALASGGAVASAPIRAALERAARHRAQTLSYEAPRPARLLIALDQVERLFVETDPAKCDAFAEVLRSLVEQRLATVVVALRSDAYARFQRAAAFITLIEDQPGATYNLLPPTHADLEDIVTKPVAVCHPPLAFEADAHGRSLAETLVIEAQGGDALSLLQMALQRLYVAEEARGDGVLRFVDYPGLGAAVAEAAKEALTTLDPPARSELPALLTALVSNIATDATGDTQPIGTAVDRAAFVRGLASRAALVDAFVAHRLLTAEEVNGTARVRPVHDALLRTWPEAVRIIGENAALIRVRHTLEPIVSDWAAASGDAKRGYLATSPSLLAGAERLLDAYKDDLSPAMQEFIAASSSAEQAARSRSQRLRRRLFQAALAAALVFFVISLVTGWQYYRAEDARRAAAEQETIAKTERDHAARSLEAAHLNQSRFLTSMAEVELRNGSYEFAALIARAALPTDMRNPDRPIWPPAVGLLAQARNLDRLRNMLVGHRAAVWNTAWSPDGTRIVTTSKDATARVWDAKTGASLALLKGHTKLVRSPAWSPDGSRIVTTSDDGTVRVWDAKTGASLAELESNTAAVRGAAWSPDGMRIVTASEGVTARIWDAKTGASLAVLNGHTKPVRSVAWSPDGSRIVTASKDATARIWDAKTGAPLVILKGETHGAPFVSRTGQTRVSDFASLEEVLDAAWSPDGTRIVTVTGPTTAPRIWDAKTGAMLAVLEGHMSTVSTAAWSPDGSHIVTASYDNTARIWDAQTGVSLVELKGHKDTIFAAAWSPDGSRIVTASKDTTAQIWDAKTGASLSVLEGLRSAVQSAEWSPDGSRIVTASADKIARIWDAVSSVVPTVRKVHAFGGWAAAWSPDGLRMVTASTDKTARIWDAKAGTPLAVLEGHTNGVESAAWSPDGSRIVTGSSDATSRIWDAKNGAELAVLRGHTNTVLTVAWSPDGARVLTASLDNTARIWDARTGAELSVLDKHDAGILAAAWSPDGARIVIAYFDHYARILDAKTGASLALLNGHTKPVWGVAWSPDGACVVTTSEDNTARKWDATTGGALAVLEGHTDRVWSAAWSRDGSRIVTASEDKTVRIWDGITGAALSVLDADPNAGQSAAWSPNGKYVVTTSGGDTIKIWDVWPLLTADTVAYASVSATRGLTAKERARLFLENPEGLQSTEMVANVTGMSAEQLRVAAVGGNPFAHRRLAEFYERGEGFEANLERALFHRAVEARLFEEAGNDEDAEVARARRGSIARALPPEVAVRIAYEAMDWQPKTTR